MNRRYVGSVVAMIVIVLAPVVSFGRVTSASPTEQLIEKGRTLLQQGDFAGALIAYQAAAMAEPENQEFANQVAMLSRVVDIREKLDNDEQAKNWFNMAVSVRAYYVQENLCEEALNLDRRVHAKMGSAKSAELLAESLLRMDQPSEVIQLVDQYDAADKTPAMNVRLGLAHAYLNQLDRARTVASQCSMPQDAPAALLYEMATLQALCGNQEAAVEFLKRTFESTLPSQLDAAKKRTQEDAKHLSSLFDTAQFVEVLKTESKVPESKCSQASGCGKCPSRSKCAQPQSGGH